jgi:hypothetical protein
MIRTLVSYALALLFSSQLYAQSPGSLVINDFDKAAIGVVEVRIYNRNDASDVRFERGTGVIVSRQGHVLTAGHVFKDDFARICRSASETTVQFRCEIAFYASGDLRQHFTTTLESDRVPSADFAVLKLPNARDVIRQPEWPHVFLARSIIEGELLSMVGYQGSDPIVAGDANRFGQQDGRLRNGAAIACTTGDGWGQAREMGGKSAEGWSGGPVFNSRQRLVGIVLGRPCPKPGSGGSVFEFDYSRILPISSMPGLCNNYGMTCEYGLPGDIDREKNRLSTPWFSRLLNPDEGRDRYAYGVRMPDIAKLLNLTPICLVTGQNASLMDRVRADVARSGQFATFIAASVEMCGNLANFRQSSSWAQLQVLADDGYNPAQYLVAVSLMGELHAQYGAIADMGVGPQFSVSDALIVAKARKYLEAAHNSRWPAASYVLFEECRQRFFECSRSQMRGYLDEAVRQGQPDALRKQSIFLLAGQGADIDIEKRYNFSLPQNTSLGVAQLTRAAQPRSGVFENASYQSYDNAAAAYLSYLYSGGTYRGQRLVDPDYPKSFNYQVACLGGPGQMPQANNPIHNFCMFAAELGQFNFNQLGVRLAVWGHLKNTNVTAGIYADLSKNIVSWSSDPLGQDIDVVDCEVAPDFSFRPPNNRPQVKPRTAYCYFPR